MEYDDELYDDLEQALLEEGDEEEEELWEEIENEDEEMELLDDVVKKMYFEDGEEYDE
jgi:hypothetical protein